VTAAEVVDETSGYRLITTEMPLAKALEVITALRRGAQRIHGFIDGGRYPFGGEVNSYFNYELDSCLIINFTDATVIISY
jgi:hypothetical protein